MMKKITLNVTLTFADSIDTDLAKAEIAKNVCDALHSYVETGVGLAPNEQETFTEKIEVFEPQTKTLRTVTL